MGIVRSLFRRGEDAEEDIGLAQAKTPDRPQLFILTPDATGIAAYQMSRYATAHEAEVFLDEHYRGEIREGTIVFWGLSWLPEPSDDGEFVEPVVLIRDLRRRGQVYTFSFADIGSAHAFIRHEMKAGLELSQVSVYWALQARITVDFWGRTTIIPPNPPRRARMHIVARREEIEAHDTADDDSEEDLEDGTTILEADEEEEVSLPQLEADLHEVVRILDARGMRPSAAEEDVSEDNELEINKGRLRAWANIMLALDEAIDAHVGRQVIATLTWRRLSAACADAVDAERAVQARKAWAHATDALAEAGALQVAQTQVHIKAWQNGSRALRRAAEIQTGRRRLRHAWLNISWTLEEAVLAARLERKGRVLFAWSVMAPALAEAAELKIVFDRGMRTAWLNGAEGALSAAEAQTAHQKKLLLAWGTAGRALFDAGKTHFRMARIEFGCRAMGEALHGAAVTHLRHEGMIAAWGTLGTEVLAAAEKQESRRMGAVLAWYAIGDAVRDGVAQKYRHTRVTIAMQNTGIALHEAAAAKFYRDAMTLSWRRISLALFEAVYRMARLTGMQTAWRLISQESFSAAQAQVKHQGAVAAWGNASAVLYEAAVAKVRHEALVKAWRNLTHAFRNAAQAYFVRQMSYRQTWERLGDAMASAIEAKVLRDGYIEAWDAAADAIVDAVQAHLYQQMLVRSWSTFAIAIGEAIPVYERHLGQQTAWGHATRALREAAVAEAQLRIAEASGDADLIKEVKLAIRKAKGVKATAAAKNGAEEAATAEEDSKSKASRKRAGAATVKGRKTSNENGEGKMAAEDDKVAADAAPEDKTEEPKENGAAEEVVDDKAAIELWRFRETGRFEARDEVFHGFESPPGRF